MLIGFYRILLAWSFQYTLKYTLNTNMLCTEMLNNMALLDESVLKCVHTY